MDHLPSESRYLAPGTKVRLNSGPSEGPEYGVVIHCWDDDEIQAWDCYVGFFGASFPTGKPREKPYVLRYAVTSLDVIEG